MQSNNNDNNKNKTGENSFSHILGSCFPLETSPLPPECCPLSLFLFILFNCFLCCPGKQNKTAGEWLVLYRINTSHNQCCMKQILVVMSKVSGKAKSFQPNWDECDSSDSKNSRNFLCKHLRTLSTYITEPWGDLELDPFYD